MKLFAKKQWGRMQTVAGLIVAITLPCVNAYSTETMDVASHWKTECVGRYQVSVPGEVEVAVNSPKVLFEGSHTPRFVFSDRSGADWGGDWYVNGYLEISPVLPPSEFERYKQKFAKPFSADQKIIPLEKNLGDGFKKNAAKGATVDFFNSGHIFAYQIHGDPDASWKNRDEFIDNFSPRALYEIPTAKGICFPFGFVKDNENRRRAVGVTMRLLDHPDVEILFKDSSAADESKYRKDVTGSRGNVEYFWSQYSPSLGNEIEGSFFNHYHKVKLGDFTGVSAFASIVRPDSNSKTTVVADAIRPSESIEQYSARIKKEAAEKKHPVDYGYVAYFKGDPNAKEDNPDLMLYVIRTASRAIAAGKEPVGKEELKKMAEQIAASIKRRPVQN